MLFSFNRSIVFHYFAGFINQLINRARGAPRDLGKWKCLPAASSLLTRCFLAAYPHFPRSVSRISESWFSIWKTTHFEARSPQNPSAMQISTKIAAQWDAKMYHFLIISIPGLMKLNFDKTQMQTMLHVQNWSTSTHVIRFFVSVAQTQMIK